MTFEYRAREWQDSRKNHRFGKRMLGVLLNIYPEKKRTEKRRLNPELEDDDGKRFRIYRLIMPG